MKSSRRLFLQTVSAATPTLRLMLAAPARAGAAAADLQYSAEKFTPLNLAGVFNTAPTGFGPQIGRAHV